MGSILLVIWKMIEILLGFQGIQSGLAPLSERGTKAEFHKIKKSRERISVPLPLFLPHRISLNLVPLSSLM